MTVAAAVSADDLWVTYRNRGSTSRSARGVGRAHALQGISTTVERGSVCGIIGPNGAGKSTLLRVIGGTLPPTRGRVTVGGKATLLAPGLGFRPNLTGLENAILGCLAQGLSRREAAAQLPPIVELAGLEDVMDWPVRTYSSGMFSRLALAVALQAEPDLLLVDEALSAGDAIFRDRIDHAVEKLVNSAATVIIISHSFPQIRRLCDRCIWVHDGAVREDGAPRDVIIDYRNWVEEQTAGEDSDGSEG